jgi:IclR family pca regulon transcriptional regulator
MNKRKGDSYFSSSLEKGLNILRLFSRDRSTWNLTQIAKSIGINKTSTFRFVNTLVQLGYLKKHPQTKLISLGPQVLGLALAFSQTEKLSDIARAFIDEISEAYRLTVELALFEEDVLVVVYRREARDELVPRFPVTRTAQRFYCTALGKAVLAHLPQKELMNTLKKIPFVRKTPYTIVDRGKFLADLQKTRERGYALNNEEWILGLTAIGAPILNLHTNKVVGGVSFDFSANRSSIKAIQEKYAKLILKLARDISEAVTVQY